MEFIKNLHYNETCNFLNTIHEFQNTFFSEKKTLCNLRRIIRLNQTAMNSTEMMSIIMNGDWRNTESNVICYFSYSYSDHSITIKYKSGNKTGCENSHQFLKLYHDTVYLKNCNMLRYQSNLFTNKFTLNSKNSPLLVVSNVFGKTKLVR